ncbi:MAG: efflux RND transporter periplasmic adaptor subunit [Desulfobaccales bacterium]
MTQEPGSRRRLLGQVALTVGVILVMVWLAGLLEFGKIPPGTATPTAPPPPGKVLTVTEQPLPRALTLPGRVISQSLAQVAAQVPGRVQQIYVQVGDRVKKGEPLLRLQAAEYEARVSQARAAVAQAQAQLTQVQADYERYRRLFREGAVSPREFEAMEARFRAARAALSQAQGQEREAAVLKGYTILTAPLIGVVAARPAAVGDLAQPGQPLLTLYDPADVQLEADVSEDQRSLLAPGMEVEVAVPAVSYEGRLPLAEIFPISQGESRTFTVRTARLTAPGLTPGMYARLRFPLPEARVVAIPRAALKRVGQLTLVDVLTEAGPVSRPVQPGAAVGELVEILSGLQPGEKIIVP